MTTPTIDNLDKSMFDTTTKVVALRVSKTNCNKLTRSVKSNLLRIRFVKPVINDPENDDNRLVLLNESIQPDLAQLPADKRAAVDEIAEGVVEHTVEYGFDSFTAEQVLKRLLPDGVEVPSSFEAMGHVAHINLIKELLDYKYLIGKVILMKNATIRTVVNKTGTIASEFRTFPLEVLAGEDDLNVVVKEHGLSFRFNVADVYWNSRLQEEHHSLVKTYFKKGDVVADACCGIGPFAVPAAKAGCVVHANDLNPKSYEYLKVNIQKNKVSHAVTPYNQDAREFLRDLVGKSSTKSSTSDLPRVGHVVMNLPAIALTFLDVFHGLFDQDRWTAEENHPTKFTLPRVHCYCFSKAEDAVEDVITRAETALGGQLDRKTAQVQEVRDVSPNKRMYCIHFQVPEQVAFATGTASSKRDGAAQSEGPDAKKQKAQ